MRTHNILFFAFLTLFVSACASKEGRNTAATQEQKQEQFSFLEEGHAARYR